jgi:hypothetical protein
MAEDITGLDVEKLRLMTAKEVDDLFSKMTGVQDSADKAALYAESAHEQVKTAQEVQTVRTNALRTKTDTISENMDKVVKTAEAFTWIKTLVTSGWLILVTILAGVWWLGSAFTSFVAEQNATRDATMANTQKVEILTKIAEGQSTTNALMLQRFEQTDKRMQNLESAVYKRN